MSFEIATHHRAYRIGQLADIGNRLVDRNILHAEAIVHAMRIVL